MRWIAAHSSRPRTDTGKPLTRLAVAGLLATKARFVQYAKARGLVLHPEQLSQQFYQDFRTYVIEELGQRVNTFGKHIDRLKTFLT